MGYHYCEVHDRSDTNGCWECVRDELRGMSPAERACWLIGHAFSEYSNLDYEGMTGCPFGHRTKHADMPNEPTDQVLIDWIQTGVWKDARSRAYVDASPHVKSKVERSRLIWKYLDAAEQEEDSSGSTVAERAFESALSDLVAGQLANRDVISGLAGVRYCGLESWICHCTQCDLAGVIEDQKRKPEKEAS